MNKLVAKTFVQFLSLLIRLTKWMSGPTSYLTVGLTGFLAFAYLGADQKKRALYHFDWCLTHLKEQLGPCHTVTAIIGGTIAKLYHDLAEYQQALSFYKQAIHIRTQLGEENSDMADLFNKMGVTYETLERYELALLCFQRASDIWEKALGTNHSEMGCAVFNAAQMYQKLNKFDDALYAYQRALEIQISSLGPNHQNVASTMNNLAGLYKTLEKFDDALAMYQGSLSIWENQRPLPEKDIGGSLMNIAELYRKQGKHKLAYPLNERALLIFEKVDGPHSMQVADLLSNFAHLESDLENFDQALQKQKRSLQILQDLLGPERPEVGVSFVSLANIYQQKGFFKEAMALCAKGFHIQKKYYGTGHLDICPAQHSLAMLYERTGYFKQALSLYKENLTILKEHFDPTHSEVARALYHLGNVYAEMGDFDRAISHYQQAVDINKTIYGQHHVHVGIPLGNLAAAFEEKGDHKKAMSFYEQALQVFKKTLGPKNLYVASTLNNIGKVHVNQNHDERAEQYFQEALQIRENILGEFHPEIADSLNNLALCLQSQENFAKALMLYERAIKIKTQSLGADHREVSIFESNLASIHLHLGNIDQAFEHFKKAIQIENGYIKAVFNSVATEKQKIACIQAINKTFRRVLSVLNEYFRNDRAAITQGFEWTLQRKGIVLQTQVNIHERVKQELTSEESKISWGRRQQLLEDLSVLLLATPQELNVDLGQYKTRIATISDEIERIEEHLILESGNTLSAFTSPTLASIRENLPGDTALVEFAITYNFHWMMSQTGTPSHYMAFVLSADGTLSLVDIGSGAEIENSIKKVRNAIQAELHECLQENPDIHTLEDCHQKAKAALRELYKKLWVPIAGHLGDPEKVFINPDWELNTVPFSALINDNEEFLIEKYSIAYLTASQDLIAKSSLRRVHELDLLTISNPEFGDIKNAEKGFAPLPQTKEEIERIRLTFPGNARMHSLSADAATKSALKKTIDEFGAPRILHLATHGYFSSSQSFGSLEYEQDDFRQNPLLRSGLAFAGANMTGLHDVEGERGNSGLLTALEVTGLNLRGCDLAVLSGCHTGFGKVQGDEGVFGLRRAFTLAGATNLMMSLWVASDEDTTQQMVTFYKKLPETSPAAALRNAQLQSIKDLKEEAGLAPISLWAPFIIQGGAAFDTWKKTSL
ncbi:MAG: CHAT domain-containing protein [Nitrospira sp.]|nr:CHAT domain-containing protein [Nitrospira sp.]MCA9498862.1 CHAT domain-containing protein [Nitrospira sp.]